ncbi:TonB-dependent receptor [Brevundimonas sp.]|uniref:TonB-dependent receptor plug domain-containing protein n=1 Tax=Brevundimonas sp. TaxID=1871086 RepID=UPI0025FE19D0|nr:TonB-dependent receptor [Brevundimonas sp.]
MSRTLLAAAAVAPLLLAAQAQAQEAVRTGPDEGEPTAVAEVVIPAQATFRNRTDDTVPTLSYEQQYFQRFEPLTVGDALRRVPSVTFLSDVLESDGARLRGLDPGYTQILIDGESVPGAGDDRSFFVDRIPAELIERVEVVRAPSARRSGDAMAGAINIVLRDAYTLDGGYLRAGARYFDNGEWRFSYGAFWGGQFGPGRLLAGLDVSERYNPKNKFSQRFDEPGGTLDNVEVQTDVRDGTDYAFNGAYELPMFGGDLELSTVFVRTDRYEDEDSWEYQDGIITNPNLLTFNDNDTDILTDNLSVRLGWDGPMAGGETDISLNYAMISDEQTEFETESEYLRDATPFPDEDRFTADQTLVDIQDEEWTLRLDHSRDVFGGDAELEFGIDVTLKTRDTSILEADRIRFNVPNAPGVRPTVPPYSGYDPVPGGLSRIEETRIDPFFVFSGSGGRVSWEAGLRWETTDSTIDDMTTSTVDESDYNHVLPSFSFRLNLSEQDRLIASVGRSVRRPNFSFLSPALLEEEFGDSDFIGNPALEPETAWGFDVGLERRLGRRGVAGINFFYRDVQDLIEYVNTGLEGSAGPGTFIYTVDNVGDGTVWGVEFDLSTPLDALGMPDTGVFLNYSWLDSEVEDFLGERRFNGQSDSVLSAGFTHDIPAWELAFGATYFQQGEAFDRFLTEEVTTTYGENLEVFIERRFGERFVLRLTGSNLLNASKDEIFDKFDNLADQVARSYDEYELETEDAGPVWQITGRWTF